MKPVMLLIVLLCSCMAYAQEDRVPVAVFPFGCVFEGDRNRASQVQAMVLDVLRNKSNINLIDRSHDTHLRKELDHQITEHSMAASGLVEQGKVMGARHMLVGTLSNVKVEQKSKLSYDVFTKKTTTVMEYTAALNFTLQISDVETGKMINHKSFSSQQSLGSIFGLLNLGVGDSPEEAIAQAIASNRRQILLWINQTYPPSIQIIRIESRNKKGLPETVLVSGVDATLQKGAKLVISETEMIDAGNGQLRQWVKKIAELKIMAVQGDITICRVTDGEKEIEEKMKSNMKMHVSIK